VRTHSSFNFNAPQRGTHLVAALYVRPSVLHLLRQITTAGI